MNRKEIDNFLIELDNFIDKYLTVLNFEDSLDFMLPFKLWSASTFWPKNKIEFKVLVKLINKSRKYRGWKMSIRRSDNFVRRVAYKLKYIYARWESYEEIFSRMLIGKNSYFNREWIILKDFYKTNSTKQEFLIPEEYIQNYNLYFTWEYIIK